PEALGPLQPIRAYAAGGPEPDRMTAARTRVMEVVKAGPPRSVADIAREAAVGDGVVRGLIKAGTLAPVDLPAETPAERPDLDRPGPTLSPVQAAIASELEGIIRSDDYRTVLLEGVTGSGKTEVYFDAMASALRHRPKGQVLVLVPEIALTSQWLSRFAERFGCEPILWHSELGQAYRRRAWRQIAKGEAPVVVGARSALFLPFPDLRSIVVDEEQDPSYKQEDGVLYNARDMAVVRGSLARIPVLLVSATPSLETEVNARSQRYAHVRLPDRHGGASMPDIEAIDMRETPPERGRWLSPPLVAAIGETLMAGEQTLLFLNRRGYAPLTLCRTCGHRFQCPNCSAWLVEHRYAGQVQCHHCGYSQPSPDICPSCQKQGTLVACGPGVERLAEEVAERFPAARLGVMASDTMTGPRAIADMISRMTHHELDIVIGTQLVAKGHHFPMLTLVGIIDADLGLEGGDLRASERTYQQLAQVSGRAGREDRPGRVLLQSYMPDHPVMAALISGDREAFLEREIASRKAAGMPPFGRLVALIVSGQDQPSVLHAARALARNAPQGKSLDTFGPAPAPMALLRGRHRYRLLFKAPRATNVQPLIRRWLATTRLPKKVRVQVDVDPYSFM
ncbi:MAG TPA: primosomal protein N', partial [Alphaproteobacteria bacterium]|nr:primosomal protein N' [Alphaproteobacteria bacterium]